MVKCFHADKGAELLKLTELAAVPAHVGAESLKKPHHIVTLQFSEVVKDHAKWHFYILLFIHITTRVENTYKTTYNTYYYLKMGKNLIAWISPKSPTNLLYFSLENTSRPAVSQLSLN